MEVKIEYKKVASGDKNDWLANHTLSKEQVAQLIRNKVERAKVYQRKEYKVFFD
jgi:hypothetical protein